MAMDPFGTPEDVLSAESSDKELHLAADRRSTAFAARFPAPPESERVVLPANDGVHLHQEGGCAPARPHLRQYRPEPSERRIESWSRLLLLLDSMLADCELALDRDEFEADGRSRSDERREEREIGADDLSDGKDGGGDAFSEAFHSSRIVASTRLRQLS